MDSTIIWIPPTLALLTGYLLGSIPFGLILTRAFGAGDIRQIGSGNIGATNVLRTGRKGLALGTVLLDMLKGMVAVWVAQYFWDAGILGGIGAVFGHCYPIWLKFKGGKGVATFMAVATALYWPLALVFAVVWLGLFALTRISSVGGIAAVLAAPIACIFMGRMDLFFALLGLALVIVWKHRENIRRLIAGTEPKFGVKKAEGAAG